MRTLFNALFALAMLALSQTPVVAGWDANKYEKESKAASAAIAEFKKRDPSLKAFFEKAYAYAVLPTIGKGAIGIGGAYGDGVVYQAGKIIGYTSMTQVTIGFQLGGQAYRELIFFKDKKTFDEFKNGKLKFSAQASAVAAKAGAAANVDYSGGVAIFTMVEGGLMYEASVGGQAFSFEPLGK